MGNKKNQRLISTSTYTKSVAYFNKVQVDDPRTTQTQNKRTHTDIHALSRIRTHDPRVQAHEDSSCLDRAATVISISTVYLHTAYRTGVRMILTVISDHFLKLNRLFL
jgi:hypothetical protein